MGTVLAINGIMAAVGGFGYLRQHRKQTLNMYHAYKAFPKHEGYHHEPEYIRDKSLLHVIQGPSDLPARVNYIKDHYHVEVKKLGKFRSKYDAMGAVLSTVIGIGVGMAISAVAMATFGIPALATSIVFGILAGGTSMAVSAADTMHRYDRYVDSVAKKAQADIAKAKKQGKQPQRDQDRPNDDRGRDDRNDKGRDDRDDRGPDNGDDKGPRNDNDRDWREKRYDRQKEQERQEQDHQDQIREQQVRQEQERQDQQRRQQPPDQNPQDQARRQPQQQEQPREQQQASEQKMQEPQANQNNNYTAQETSYAQPQAGQSNSPVTKQAAPQGDYSQSYVQPDGTITQGAPQVASSPLYVQPDGTIVQEVAYSQPQANQDGGYIAQAKPVVTEQQKWQNMVRQEQERLAAGPNQYR